MASVKNLKRDLGYVLGDIIEAAYIHQLANPEEDHTKSDKIIEEAVTSFDGFIVKINDKDAERNGAYFKSINKEVEEKAQHLVEKINTL